MKNLLLLLLFLLFFNCGDLQHCDYKVAVEYEDGVQDTLKFTLISNLQNIRLEEGHLRMGQSIKYKDSIKSFEILEETCVIINDSLVVIQ